jgi:hypothetical protein
MRVPKDVIGELLFTLSRGYRAIADVDLPATACPQGVRVVSDDNRSMDDVLDAESDWRVELRGRVSLGPLAPEGYLIELQGTDKRRQARIRIVDRDGYAIVR